MVTALVPSLSKSLAEQFNVFRVMRHGTHEKQLSNVFAWLLRDAGTHELGDAFQQMFVEHVNRALLSEDPLPTTGYRVLQEVDTSGPEALGKDFADIVLSGTEASIVVENFESSDGHGHNYRGYLEYGEQGDRRSVVVLLCARRESHRQVEGWQQAVVVTYAELLEGLKEHVADHPGWRRQCPQQLFFSEVKGALKRYAQQTLMVQVNDALETGHIASAYARFVGQWEWCVTLERSDSESIIFLEFGPTAAAQNAQAPLPLEDADYTKVFVTRKATRNDTIDQIAQTDVGLDEVLAGLDADDFRLRDGVLAVVRAH